MDKEKLQRTVESVENALIYCQADGIDKLDGQYMSIDTPSEVGSLLPDFTVSDNNLAKAKQIVGTALKIAAKRGIVDISDPIALAAAADAVVDTIKVAYDVDTGVVDPEAAISKLVDRAAARMVVIAEHVIDKCAPRLIETLAIALSKAFPPIQPLIPIIVCVAHVCVPPVKKAIKKGINAIANCAKRVLTKGVKYVTNLITRAKNKSREALANEANS